MYSEGFGTGEAHGADRPGTAAVVDGRVVVEAPVGNGKRATIRPSSHVTITVNGQVIKEETPVGPGDRIEAAAISEEPEVSIEVRASGDRMSATAIVTRRPGARYELADADPAERLEVTAHRVGETDPPAVSREALLAALKEAGITGDLDEEGIDRLTGARAWDVDLEAVVVRGRPPTETQDASLRLPVEEEEDEPDLESERVDLLDRGTVRAVHEGDLVAEWIEAVPGEDGMDVYGRVIPARRPKPLTLKLGEGVRREGARIVATRAGRPFISGTSVAVLPFYQHPGNLTVETGHIDFDGVVQIRGDVEERLRVRAGSVEVDGSVMTSARIEAQGHVTVRKNVFGATILAGGDGAVYVGLEKHLAALEPLLKEAVEGILQAVEQLAKAGRQVSPGRIAPALLSGRFAQATKAAARLGAFVLENKASVDSDLAAIAVELERSLTGSGPLKWKQAEDVRRLVNMIETAKERLSQAAAASADVTVNYLQNSVVSCSGRVIITGKACYNSEVEAGRGVEARSAVVRGGTIHVARGVVRVKELGSASAVPTVVEVGIDGRIEADVIYPRVKCSIGRHVHVFHETVRHAVVTYDESENRLRFYG